MDNIRLEMAGTNEQCFRRIMRMVDEERKRTEATDPLIAQMEALQYVGIKLATLIVEEDPSQDLAIRLYLAWKYAWHESYELLSKKKQWRHIEKMIERLVADAIYVD